MNEEQLRYIIKHFNLNIDQVTPLVRDFLLGWSTTLLRDLKYSNLAVYTYGEDEVYSVRCGGWFLFDNLNKQLAQDVINTFTAFEIMS